MNLEERIWGYTGAVGMTQAFAAGYFMWDVKISAMNVGILGWGSLAHAVSALLITSLGFVCLSVFIYDGVEVHGADIMRFTSVHSPTIMVLCLSYMLCQHLS